LRRGEHEALLRDAEIASRGTDHSPDEEVQADEEEDLEPE
jgi:hypothetical protein